MTSPLKIAFNMTLPVQTRSASKSGCVTPDLSANCAKYSSGRPHRSQKVVYMRRDDMSDVESDSGRQPRSEEDENFFCREFALQDDDVICPMPGCSSSGHISGEKEFHKTLAGCPTYFRLTTNECQVQQEKLTGTKSSCRLSIEADNSLGKSWSKLTITRELHLSPMKSESPENRFWTLNKQLPPSVAQRYADLQELGIIDTITSEPVLDLPDLRSFAPAPEVQMFMDGYSQSVRDEDFESYLQSCVVGSEHQRYALRKLILAHSEVDMLYPSPFPAEFTCLRTLCICEFCLRMCKTPELMLSHMIKCPRKSPPGVEIYRKDDVSLFEIDGGEETEYARALCLIAKAFIKSKTLSARYMERFMFYVLTQNDETGSHLIGYFSKEKDLADGHNLSVILTLPCYQRKGYGKMLIDFSYHLGKLEGRPHGPERPLSDMGYYTYQSYWKDKILEYFDHHRSLKDVSLAAISEESGIEMTDLAHALCDMHLIGAYGDSSFVNAAAPPPPLAALSLLAKNGSGSTAAGSSGKNDADERKKSSSAASGGSGSAGSTGRDVSMAAPSSPDPKDDRKACFISRDLIQTLLDKQANNPGRLRTIDPNCLVWTPGPSASEGASTAASRRALPVLVTGGVRSHFGEFPWAKSVPPLAKRKQPKAVVIGPLTPSPDGARRSVRRKKRKPPLDEPYEPEVSRRKSNKDAKVPEGFDAKRDFQILSEAGVFLNSHGNGTRNGNEKGSASGFDEKRSGDHMSAESSATHLPFSFDVSEKNILSSTGRTRRSAALQSRRSTRIRRSPHKLSPKKLQPRRTHRSELSAASGAVHSKTESYPLKPVIEKLSESDFSSTAEPADVDEVSVDGRVNVEVKAPANKLELSSPRAVGIGVRRHPSFEDHAFYCKQTDGTIAGVTMNIFDGKEACILLKGGMFGDHQYAFSGRKAAAGKRSLSAENSPLKPPLEGSPRKVADFLRQVEAGLAESDFKGSGFESGSRRSFLPGAKPSTSISYDKENDFSTGKPSSLDLSQTATSSLASTGSTANHLVGGISSSRSASVAMASSRGESRKTQTSVHRLRGTAYERNGYKNHRVVSFSARLGSKSTTQHDSEATNAQGAQQLTPRRTRPIVLRASRRRT